MNCALIGGTNFVGAERELRDAVKEMITKRLRKVLFDIRAGNSNLAKSLSEKSNHAMYQDENTHRCLLSLQN